LTKKEFDNIADQGGAVMKIVKVPTHSFVSGRFEPVDAYFNASAVAQLTDETQQNGGFIHTIISVSQTMNEGVLKIDTNMPIDEVRKLIGWDEKPSSLEGQALMMQNASEIINKAFAEWKFPLRWETNDIAGRQTIEYSRSLLARLAQAGYYLCTEDEMKD
jgi:hypothetical protein